MWVVKRGNEERKNGQISGKSGGKVYFCMAGIGRKRERKWAYIRDGVREELVGVRRE